MQNLIDAPELRRLLSYDPETGEFRWRVYRNWRITAGDLAGSLNGYGHRQIKIHGTMYMAHRLAWLYVYDEWPRNDLDHINGLPDDNRLANLREATDSQNIANSHRRVDNTSGYKGVTWDRSAQKWLAYIRVNGKRSNFGYFDDPVVAHAVYLDKARELFGEFARAA
jgi:hypothetical protein